MVSGKRLLRLVELLDMGKQIIKIRTNLFPLKNIAHDQKNE
jgi:hypothetical protein